MRKIFPPNDFILVWAILIWGILFLLPISAYLIGLYRSINTNYLIIKVTKPYKGRIKQFIFYNMPMIVLMTIMWHWSELFNRISLAKRNKKSQDQIVEEIISEISKCVSEKKDITIKIDHR